MRFGAQWHPRAPDASQPLAVPAPALTIDMPVVCDCVSMWTCTCRSGSMLRRHSRCPCFTVACRARRARGKDRRRDQRRRPSWCRPTSTGTLSATAELDVGEPNAREVRGCRRRSNPGPLPESYSAVIPHLGVQKRLQMTTGVHRQAAVERHQTSAIAGESRHSLGASERTRTADPSLRGSNPLLHDDLALRGRLRSLMPRRPGRLFCVYSARSSCARRTMKGRRRTGERHRHEGRLRLPTSRTVSHAGVMR